MATLACGGVVPIVRAAAFLSQLRSFLEHQDTEWDVVYYLRELCLGRSIEPEQKRCLVREGLLSATGDLDPDLRSVVLSAVRGEGRVLTVSSPFTDAADRAVAEFLNARHYITCFLDEAEAKQLLAGDPIDEIVRKVLRDEAGRPTLGNPDALAREMLRRKRRADDSPQDPPPR